MEYHEGFIVTLHNREGKAFKTLIPPVWWPSGAERRQAKAQERAKLQAGKFRRYWEALRQKRVM
jgi:hypothetical protein